MRHIGWFTLIALCLFAVKGFERRSPDSHARNLVQLSENKANGFHMEKEVFDNRELRHIASLKEALKKSGTPANAPRSSGEIEIAEDQVLK